MVRIMAEEVKINKAQRVLRGEVLSDKMDKTIVVRVERTYIHPKFKKVMRTFKNYKVHDEVEKANVGDVVEISQGRPVSKTKYMYLDKIISNNSSK